MILRRRAFAEVIARQLDLFVSDHAALIEACDRAERAYDSAGRDEAEERYAEYLDLVEEGTEALAAMRDAYAARLGADEARAYETAFNREVARRLPRFALGIADA